MKPLLTSILTTTYILSTSANACDFPVPEDYNAAAEFFYDAIQNGDHKAITNDLFAIPIPPEATAEFVTQMASAFGTDGYQSCRVLMTRRHSPIFKTQLAEFARPGQLHYTFTFLTKTDGEWRVHTFKIDNKIEKAYGRLR